MPGKNSLIMPSRLTVLWHGLEFLPGVYPVTNALTIGIYSYNTLSNGQLLIRSAETGPPNDRKSRPV